MGIRDALNKRPAIVAAIVIGLFVVAVGIYFATRTTATLPGPVTQVYYSDDDGKTYFVGDANKVYPFDHSGKLAYRAFVYRCGGGQPFVAYLMRYSDDAKAKLTELKSKPNNPDAAAAIAELQTTGLEVKKPGDEQWSPANPASPEEDTGAMSVKCPDGGKPVPVNP